jgi:putative heme iron utilization protein
MSEPITPQVSDRICKHMNEDHAEAVLTYARVFAGAAAATAATMKAIDPTGMDLEAQVAGSPVSLRVPFEPPLSDAKAAHHTLVEMLKQARC